MVNFISNSDIETQEIAKRFVDMIPLGSVVLLTGDLGAGKTTFVKGVAKALGITEKINSPTFNIMKLYLSKKSLIHIDAYRLENMDSNIGLDEYIGYERGLTMIEWPQYISNLLPKDAYVVDIKNIGEDKREITITGGSL